MNQEHIVLSRDIDRDGSYHLATKTVFESAEAAALYAETIARSRQAVTIPLRNLMHEIADLRYGEERGTEAYWANPAAFHQGNGDGR